VTTREPASPRAELDACLRAALGAVDAEIAVARALGGEGPALTIAGRSIPADAQLVALAVGKAAAAMARALERRAGERIRSGLVVTKQGHGLPLERFAQRETGHPLPDARGEAAAREALDLVAASRPEDVLLLLLSGGASALLPAPAESLCLSDLEATTRALLGCGADIEETNVVRKHLSSVAGGRLALAAAAGRIEVLAVSDVPGDRLDLIGSGPAAPDPSTYADALAVLQRRGIAGDVPRAVWEHLGRGARGELPETPKPGAPELARVRHTIVASNRDARRAAVSEARARGLAAIDLGEGLRGEARVMGARLAALGLGVEATEEAIVVVGGETSVTLRGGGRGGRNQELALAAALALDGSRGVALLAAGTDGSDGPTDAAGAFADGGSVARGAARGASASRALAENDAYSFFQAEGGILRTGPTRTNVMDLALVRVSATAGRGRGPGARRGGEG
jgi:glycerate 2-kinase